METLNDLIQAFQDKQFDEGPSDESREKLIADILAAAWTSIEDGLPEVGDYRVWCGDKLRRMYHERHAFFNGETWQHTIYGNPITGVTHWQEINPPEVR